MKTAQSTYEQQAIIFLKKTGATIDIKFLFNGKHFEDDKGNRDVYEITIKRGKRSMIFKFGNSINNSGFFYKIGVKKIELDRKYLNNSNLKAIIRHFDHSYMPNIDIIHKPVAPSDYDVLACLQKYDVGTFNDFCSEFGHDADSKKAEKIYNGVVKEYLQVSSIFSESEIEELQEIN